MAVEFKAQISGTEQLLKALLVSNEAIVKETGRLLYYEATQVFDRSQDIVPIDTGALRSSGFVQQPEVKGNEISVTVAYGGAAAPYAVIQHENLEYHHEPPTQAKYLETPLVERIDNIREGLQGIVSKAILPEKFSPEEMD